MKEAEWRMHAVRADFNGIAKEFHIDPVAARVMVNRGVSTPDAIRQFLNGTLSDVGDPALMADMTKAVGIMEAKIRGGKKIRIISDYDVDGVMSNYILLMGLREAGANVSYEIPDRKLDGYGINERMIEDAHADGVDTIITCDNGIAAFPAIELGKKYGMTVIVTDHHEVPYETDDAGARKYLMVPADAVVDIKRPDCPYPYKELCGAAVAYKFIRALYSEMGLAWPDEKKYIEYVAIATVCDVMALTGENRIYVREGLKLLPLTDNHGLQALLSLNGLEKKELSAYHLGFVIGPCINATGRLESAKEGLALLLSETREEALAKAEKVVELNNERKDMTKAGTEEAIAQVETMHASDHVLVVYLPKLHESLAGIVAGRVREAFYKPVFVITDAENGGAKGSGRSIEGYHMYDALTEVSHLLTKFGGHELAAGFSLPREKIDDFRKELNAREHLTEQDLTPVKRIDVPMPTSYASIALVRDLEKLAPFGKGNEKPLFGELRLGIRSASTFGKEGQFIRMKLVGAEGFTAEAVDFDAKSFIERIKMWFGEEDCDKMLRGLPNGIKIDILYYPEINSYGGRESVQIRPADYRKSDTEAQ